jgi:YbbR domain-containing protein
LEYGQHTLPIEVDVNLGPVRVVSVSPETVTVELEPLAMQTFPVNLEISGEPTLGFAVDQSGLTIEPEAVSVSGPQSLVAEVADVRGVINVDGARETLTGETALQAVDADGNVLSGLTIQPQVVSYTQTLVQEGGYREVAVVVETIGLQANGFRVTNITVSPPIITLFSSDPTLVLELPGFVSTLPLDINGADDDIETRLALDLPEGVIVVGEEQNVFVVIGIAPIESSIVLELPVEIIGLGNNLQAVISPEEVSVILSGPLAVLENLQPGDVRLLVDLSGLGVGTHLVEPQAEILPDGVEVLSVTPSSIEVVITRR